MSSPQQQNPALSPASPNVRHETQPGASQLPVGARLRHLVQRRRFTLLRRKLRELQSSTASPVYTTVFDCEVPATALADSSKGGRVLFSVIGRSSAARFTIICWRDQACFEAAPVAVSPVLKGSLAEVGLPRPGVWQRLAPSSLSDLLVKLAAVLGAAVACVTIASHLLMPPSLLRLA